MQDKQSTSHIPGSSLTVEDVAFGVKTNLIKWTLSDVWKTK